MPSHRASATSTGMRPVSLHRSGRKRAPCCRSAAITSAGAEHRQLRRCASPYGGEQPAEVLAPEEADWSCRRGRCPRAADRPRYRLACVGAERAYCQATETDLAVVAQLVEQRGLITGNPGGKYRRLPSLHRRLDSLQLLDDLGKPAHPEEAVARTGVLPTHEEAHELPGREGLDKAPRPVTHGCVDPHEQVAGRIAVAGIVTDTEPQHRTLVLELSERRADPPLAASCEAEALRQVARRERLCDLEMAPDGVKQRQLGQ